jgi:hypothetical protein
MTTVSAWVPPQVEKALEEYAENNGVDRETAVRQLLERGVSRWRIEHALDLLDDGEVTLSRAAEIADVSVWDFRDRADAADVAWVDDRTVDFEDY